MKTNKKKKNEQKKKKFTKETLKDNISPRFGNKDIPLKQKTGNGRNKQI